MEIIGESKDCGFKMDVAFLGNRAAALFLFAACQQPEFPAQPKSQDATVRTPAVAPAGGESRLVPEAGRKATDAEVARFLAAREGAPAVELPEGPSPLAKSAALPTCTVDFNNVNSLALIPSQANATIALTPFYKQPCIPRLWFLQTPSTRPAIV